MRAFFGIELPGALREAIAARVAELAGEAPGVHWTDAAQYHVTLKFLGEVAERQVPELLRAATRRLARSEPFEAELGGFGGFPSARAARVAWVGVGAGSGALARLAHKLDSAAAKLGFTREPRPYHAHITVGRLHEPAPLPLAQLTETLSGSFPVSQVVLFESRLAPHGAEYRACGRIALPPGEESEAHALDEFAAEF